MNRKKKHLSLYAIRKIIPIVNVAKVAGFLGTILFQLPSTRIPMFLCAGFTLLMLTTDTYVKLSLWKCPSCSKQLPSDFYNRKTITHCPACREKLDFENKHWFIPEDEPNM